MLQTCVWFLGHLQCKTSVNAIFDLKCVWLLGYLQCTTSASAMFWCSLGRAPWRTLEKTKEHWKRTKNTIYGDPLMMDPWRNLKKTWKNQKAAKSKTHLRLFHWLCCQYAHGDSAEENPETLIIPFKWYVKFHYFPIGKKALAIVFAIHLFHFVL